MGTRTAPESPAGSPTRATSPESPAPCTPPGKTNTTPWTAGPPKPGAYARPDNDWRIRSVPSTGLKMGSLLDGVSLLEPWVLTSERLEEQLHRELDPSHPLFGVKARAIARRADNDDVLFELSGAPHPLAVVHLTWGQIPDFPADYPVMQFYRSTEDWIENCMKVDH